jgi:hypothetical protein
MAPKNIKKSIRNSIPKIDRKSVEKTWKMEPLNLGIHCFSEGKTYISQKSRFLDLFEKVVEKVIKNNVKIHPKTVKKSMQNRGAEKYRTNMPKCQEKGRKRSPKGSRKSTKSMQKSMPEKG